MIKDTGEQYFTNKHTYELPQNKLKNISLSHYDNKYTSHNTKILAQIPNG